MPFALPCLLVAILLAPGVALAMDEPTRTLPGAHNCAVELPTTIAGRPWTPEGGPWTAAESYAWREICLGRTADMRGAAAEEPNLACNPAEIDGDGAPPSHRELRPAFFQLILTREPWVSTPVKPEVSVRCAVITGSLDLENQKIAPEFRLFSSTVEGDAQLFGTQFERSLDVTGGTVKGQISAVRMEVSGGLFLGREAHFQGVELLGARINGDVEAMGSTFEGLFNADYIEVGGSLVLHGGAHFQGVDLLGARINGDVVAMGSTFEGLFNADRMEVGGSLFLSGGAHFQGIDLLGARINDDVEAMGSTFEGLFNADYMEVGGRLFLNDEAHFQGVDLLGARINGDVEATGSTFDGLFNADRMEVGGSLFRRGAAHFQGVDLLGASVGGNLELKGGQFKGKVDLTETSIGLALVLSQANASLPVWGPESVLILRNADAGALQARELAWTREDGEWLHTDLTGFEYQKLGGLSEENIKTMADADVAWFKSWIAAQLDHGKVYDPQPYQQLAQALAFAGNEAGADAMRYARHEHRHAVADLGLGTWVGLFLSKYIVGHGVYPFRVLWWFAGLVFTGFVVLSCAAPSAVDRPARRFWYSVENALPLVQLSESHKSVQLEGWVETFFHAQKVLGFVLATVLVGALTLLGG